MHVIDRQARRSLDVELGTLSFMQAMLRNVALPSPQGMIPLGDIIEAQQDKIITGQVEFDPSKIKLLEGNVQH